ncbi:diguanylate cyclase (GGDEF) domain-containing protein [Hoeflea sp. IMCC20628]|uniref:putative bifunctional diguanylate cyclase/phosphodiesterase n=1 Tax=Hoeflea sp. IMCC20628 TaxID=1620421 RepID=UPI00063BF5D8|nr:EAL domain-containing protein [Hoeflea sp. IMCC20628]AKI01171.1 diguanylate cyclase (GGDEF) domain-containing protein [Hoeflea sp. IMCC20628]
MRLPTTTFNLLALAGLIALGAVGWIHARLTAATEESVALSARYDVTWTGSAGRMEILELQKWISDYIASGSPEDAAQVELYSQIVEGRLANWNAGKFGEYLDMLPDRRASFDSIRAEFIDAVAEIGNLDDPQVQQILVARLNKIAPVIHRIGADAHTSTMTVNAEIRNTLFEEQRVQKYLSFGLVGAGILMVLIMIYQNRSLERANRGARRAAEGFSDLAHHDSLTGLPNRLAFKSAFETAMALQDGGRNRLAVFAIDLDGFKGVNDLLGHAAGDDLLVSVADRLRRLFLNLGVENIVSRFGGDEFVVLLQGEAVVCRHEAIAAQMLAELREPYVVQNSTVAIGATVGLALLDRVNDSASDPLLDADLALSNAKALGKGIVVKFEPSMRKDFERRGRLESDMKSALRNGDIFPFYQMQVDIETGQLVGFEALARWNHPELGWIGPYEFIPIAESSSQIVELGRCILTTACAQAMAFPDNIRVSVNLSVGQMLRDDVIGMVTDILASTGFPASRLTLEVTESVMMSEPQLAARILNGLKDLGISIALDDFGTGYSALSYLRQFDWDELKIDKSFVDDLGHDPRSLSIIEAVVDLATELGMKVVAEGVETADQLGILRKSGCHIAQGYLFGRPEPIDQVHLTLLKSFAQADAEPNLAVSI